MGQEMDPTKASGYLCAVARSRDQIEVLLGCNSNIINNSLAASPYLTSNDYNSLAALNDVHVRRRALWRCSDTSILRAAATSRNERIREAALSNPHMPIEVLEKALELGSFSAAINPATPEPARREALTTDRLHQLALTGRHLPYNASDRRAARCWALVSHNPWLHEDMKGYQGTLRAAMGMWEDVIDRGCLELADERILEMVSLGEAPEYVVNVVAQRNPSHSGLLALVVGISDQEVREAMIDAYTLGRLSLVHGPRIAVPWDNDKANNHPAAPFTPCSDLYLPGRNDDWLQLEAWAQDNGIQREVIDTINALAPGWTGDMQSLLQTSTRL
jgi:hypothetical protein